MTRLDLQLVLLLVGLSLLLTLTGSNAQDKWSRQVEPVDPGEEDSFDWIPLAQPGDTSVGSQTKDRSANGRVLTYSQSFPPNARFGDLPPPRQQPKTQHVAAATQKQFFNFPFEFQRFAQPQAQTLRQPPLGPLKSQEPTSQSFFKFEMPLHHDNTRAAAGQPTVQTGYQIQHTFGGGAQGQGSLFSSPLFNQQPVFPPEFHPLPQKPVHLQKPLQQQNFIDDTFPLKNTYRNSKPTQQTLQSVTPQVFPVDPQPEPAFEVNKPTAFQPPGTYSQSGSGASPASAIPIGGGQSQQQPQEVQLLYVPYDTLYNQQQPQGPPGGQSSAFDVDKYNVNPGLPAVNPYQINQFYTQDPLAPLNPNYFSSSTTSRPQTTSAKPSNVYQNFVEPQYTTAKPKTKPKAHQPPLAMFLLRSTARPTQVDIVGALRNSNTIAVIDSPTRNNPDIFVGPAGMPTPEGYVKFELPYLSQLSQSRDLHDVPYFVAPLSYRTPSGFHKILLPEPHVGSIVINRSKDKTAQEQFDYNSPTPNDANQYTTSTQRPRPSHKPQPSTPKDFYQDVVRQPTQQQKNRDQYEITTQRATLQPTRGNKFSYFYDLDAIEEVTSPKLNKQERPKKKRPQSVQVEHPTYSTPQANNPYAQFNPIPNQIINDDYFKVQTNKPSSTSTSSTSTTSTTSTTTTTSTTPPPPTYFSYGTSPQLDFHSSNGQLYPNFNTADAKAPSAPAPEQYVPRFTTRPPPVTTADEEYRMKQYFRQQDAFRNRPQPTNPPFQQVEYTPVTVSFDASRVPQTTQRTTTAKQRVTYYTPPATPAPSAEDTSSTEAQQITDSNVPVNHRPSYNQNEILDGTVEYEPNPYQLPSELPPLTPNLPGLVNNLQEKNKQLQHTFDQSTTPIPEQEQPTRPTRRPINRVRKPVVAKVTSSVSYSESEATTRRPSSNRVRRPFGSRGTQAAAEAATAEAADSNSSTTTRRPSSARNPVVRNPNRIRYQPTSEERQSLRIKSRKPYKGSTKVSDSEDLEYQRDVLKQNYPVIKPASGRRPSSPTAIPSYAGTTEVPTSETQQVYTVTPSNNIVDNNEQTFPAGLLEPMQIAQQYNEYSKDNYGPGYFPNQEDLNPTEPVRNEISPVYTTTTTTTAASTTTTTEEPTATTRRAPFLRRNYPRLRTTTTEVPTTTAAPEEKSSIRPRIPARKVIKVRTRPRRPLHPASSTTAPEEEPEQPQPEPQKNSYRKVNRFNQELYENDTPRRRYKNQFQLEGQESQWPVASGSGSGSGSGNGNSNGNNFKPIDPKDALTDNQHNFANEPEIVTVDPAKANAAESKSETYEFNVSANFGSSGKGSDAKTRTTLKAPNLQPEKSFAELLEEVMGKAPEEKPLDSVDDKARTTDGSYFESQKTTVSSRLNRRNKFKKLRVPGSHNNESFETAESQGLGAQLLNSLYTGGQEKSLGEVGHGQELKTTTPLTPASEAGAAEPTEMTPSSVTMTTTTAATTSPPSTQTTAIEYEMTTPKQLAVITTTTTTPVPMGEESKSVTSTDSEETATRRIDEEDMMSADDLEIQPSLFSEVRKQLHELFAIEESDEQAVTAALAAVGRRRQEYTNIKRTTAMPTTEAATPVPTEPTTVDTDSKKSAFHKNLMDQVVYATSTSMKVSSETEICYRGRCIRSEDLPKNHKLN